MAAAVAAQSSGHFAEYSAEFSNTDQDRKPFPVVNHVITEKEIVDIRKVQQNPSTKINLERLLKLLKDKHSKSLVDRHYRAIKILYSSFKNGIQLKDVNIILEILKKCHQYLHVDSRYEESFCLILDLLSNPFLKSKVSDEIIHLSSVTDCFTEIGILAESSSDKIKCSTGEAISSLYKQKRNYNSASLDPQPVSSKFIREAIGKSAICQSLAECFSQVSENATKYVLLKSLATLSDSKLTCDGMLIAGVASCICLGLSQDLKNYKLMFLGAEALWNVLEYGSQVQIQRQLSSLECLRSLKQILVYNLTHCNSHAERQLRNDIFLVITLVISKCPEAPLVESGLAKAIAAYTSYPEIPSRDTSICRMQIGKHGEDFELKKLLLSAINILCVHTSKQTLTDTLSSTQVMLALFHYVIPIKEPLETHWSLAEFEELQLQAMSVLSVLAPLSLKDYVTFQGNSRILAVLDWCVNTEEFGGHGNSFFGVGGRGSKRAQLRHCIRLLRSVCNAGNEDILQDLTDQGLISQIVAILTSCTLSGDSNDAIDIDLQCDMLYILAILCESDIHRKELFGESGVSMLVQYLSKYFKTSNNLLDNNKLILSTADCIWSTVIGCYLNEICFLEKEGAFLMLDLLESCPVSMQNVVMGIIVDLMENKNTLKHFHLWRGKEEKTVSKLLIDLWIVQEKQLLVKRDRNGVITDPTKPLKTNHQLEYDYVILPVIYASPAVVDISDNLRAKVYSLFSKIGFKNVTGLDAVDCVTLSIVEHYLDFKTLEIWQEIRDELEGEQIEPVSSDKECMTTIINFLQSKTESVAEIQNSLLQNNVDDQLKDENQFYQKIKESHKQEEKEYQDFMHFVERTSNHSTLKNAKRVQMEHVKRSRAIVKNSTDEDSLVIKHETLDSRLQTTVFCGRNIVVKSTILENHVTKELERTMLPTIPLDGNDSEKEEESPEILEI